MKSQNDSFKPLVSVVMSVYNESEVEIVESINSILNQTYDNIELIVVCDNPNNSEIIKLLKSYKKKDGRIRLIINQENIGLAQSLNKGIELSKGQYIARMDADDISVVTRIEKEMGVLLENNYDMITSGFDCIDEKGDKVGVRSKSPSNYEDIKKILPLANFICHPSVIINKRILEKTGCYRDFKVAQDYDLWLRVLTSCGSIGVLNEVLLHYRIRTKSLSSQNALRRIIYVDYQKKLYKERLNSGNDSFTQDYIKKLDELIYSYLNDGLTDKLVSDLLEAIENRNTIKLLRNYMIALLNNRKPIVRWINDLIRYAILKKIKGI